MSQRLRIIWRVDKEIPDGCLSSGVICYFKIIKIVIGRWRLWAVLFHHPSIMVWA